MNFSPKKPTRKILIVDDEIDVLEFLEIYLDSLKWEVVAANTIEKAFEALEKESFFLILTDIAMPDMDGYEFLDKVKDNVASQLAFMTGFGYNPNHTIIKINKVSRYTCIFKPFNREKLSEIIRKAHETYHAEMPDASV